MSEDTYSRVYRLLQYFFLQFKETYGCIVRQFPKQSLPDDNVSPLPEDSVYRLHRKICFENQRIMTKDTFSLVNRTLHSFIPCPWSTLPDDNMSRLPEDDVSPLPEDSVDRFHKKICFEN